MTMRRTFVLALAGASLALAGGLALAAGQYGPGASDTEIKLGNTMPYSGPASAYGAIGKAETAYFDMINEQGGINGRKIDFISRDDGYSPPKTVEAVRKLVEEDHVLALFNTLGTPPNSAIRGYLNENKVPQMFVATGANKWNDPKAVSLDHGLAAQLPDRSAHLCPLHPQEHAERQDRRALSERRFRQGLPDRPAAGAGRQGGQDDRRHQDLRDHRSDHRFANCVAAGQRRRYSPGTAAIPKFAAQAIRKVYDIGWKPAFFMTNVAVSITAVIQPAGPEKAVGIITAGYLKDPTDPQWQGTPEYKDWLAWMKKYNPSANVADANNVYGYSVAQTMVAVLKQCGNNLTRENLMKQAASIHDLKLPMLLPGIIVSTSPPILRRSSRCSWRNSTGRCGSCSAT